MRNDDLLQEKEDVRPNRERWVARIMMCVYVAFLFLIAAIGFYILFYVFFLVSFVVLASVVDRLKSFDLVDSLALQKKLVLIFLVALAVRFLMLAQDQIITHDILFMVSRGEHMLNGRIPYVDFSGGCKPPLYNLTLFVVSSFSGAGQMQFRAAFSAVDALIAVLVFFLCGHKGGRFALSASLLYSLSPINVITIGLSGHFDPVPTLVVVISAVFLISGRNRLSSLFLGLGFAFKLFAAALLPYYVSRIRTPVERSLSVLIFLLPMVLSLLGLYLISEEAPLKYFSETSGWKGVWSFNHILTVAVGSNMLGPLKISWISMGFFTGLILAMYVSIWTRKHEDETIIFWFKAVILIYTIYWALMILDAWSQRPSDTDILPFVIGLIVYCSSVGFLTWRYRDTIFPKSLFAGSREKPLIIITLALTLFCFGLPNFSPWYIVWLLPFLLSIRTDEIRLTLLVFSVWHIMGIGVSILPGLPPIN